MISPEPSNVSPMVCARSSGGASSRASLATSGAASAYAFQKARAAVAIPHSSATGRSSSAPSTISFSAAVTAASISGAASAGGVRPDRNSAAISATCRIQARASSAVSASGSAAHSARPRADSAAAVRRAVSSAQSSIIGRKSYGGVFGRATEKVTASGIVAPLTITEMVVGLLRRDHVDGREVRSITGRISREDPQIGNRRVGADVEVR